MADSGMKAYIAMPEKPHPRTGVHQLWVSTGTPVVDGKYIDFATGDLKTVVKGEEFMSGPPAVELFWHNRYSNGDEKLFGSFAAHAFISVTEYLQRLGNFIAKGSCEIWSLNATRYSVYVTVATQLSEEEMTARMEEAGIFPALKNIAATTDAAAA